MTNLEILRFIADAPVTRAAIKRQFSSHIAKGVMDSILDGMLADGVISMSYGKLRITNAGLRKLPVKPETVVMRPYVPPRVIRRAGSDRASKLPSVFAGRRVER